MHVDQLFQSAPCKELSPALKLQCQLLAQCFPTWIRGQGRTMVGTNKKCLPEAMKAITTTMHHLIGLDLILSPAYR
jgi:hypothetical protein